MTDECPNGCDNKGSEIAEEHRHLYGGKTHYSKVIGYEFSNVYDGILIWGCQKCGAFWPRFNPPDRRHRIAVEMIERWKREIEERNAGEDEG